MTFDSPAPWLYAICFTVPAVVIVAALGLARRYVRGTTLLAPWCWALLALAVLVGVEFLALLVSEGTPRWLGAARYVAAVATFCPTMAVLGAKRPQERAWHIIVLALWFVLALPALQDVIYHYGRPISLDSAWRGFVALLIAVGWVNYLPTRYWPASILYGAAQVVLLADYLPLGDKLGIDHTWRVPVALSLFALAAALPALGWPSRTTVADPAERLWRDFRDCYGILWAVRVDRRATETVNAAAPTDGSRSDPEALRANERTLIAHLQRFVSRSWIIQRLPSAFVSFDPPK
ncbi:MAG TPA: hypothetical protein VGN12_26335 [Pirellulales bacterium]|jgi:hypothetical protein